MSDDPTSTPAGVDAVKTAAPEAVAHRIDVTTLGQLAGAGTLRANEIGLLRLRLAEPVFAGAYRANRTTGSAILIDEATNATVAAVLVTDGERWP